MQCNTSRIWHFTENFTLIQKVHVNIDSKLYLRYRVFKCFKSMSFLFYELSKTFKLNLVHNIHGSYEWIIRILIRWKSSTALDVIKTEINFPIRYLITNKQFLLIFLLIFWPKSRLVY